MSFSISANEPNVWFNQKKLMLWVFLFCFKVRWKADISEYKLHTCFVLYDIFLAVRLDVKLSTKPFGKKETS